MKVIRTTKEEYKKIKHDEYVFDPDENREWKFLKDKLIAWRQENEFWKTNPET